MKKMLLAFVVMAFAAAAQAVALAWTTPSANTWYTENMSCSLIYAADANATAEDAVSVAMGTAMANYEVVGSKIEWANEDEGYSYTDVATQSSGTYFIVFTEGDTYAVTSVLAADTVNAWTPAMGSSDSAINFAPVEVADFTRGVVPEPTALALLALGVAGLALRRRA